MTPRSDLIPPAITQLDLPLSAPRRVVRRRRTPPYRGMPPVVPGSATSEAAARRVEPTRMTKREQVYQYILSRGAEGATRREIASALGLSENTVRPRVCELMNAHDAATNRARVRTDPSGAARQGCAVLLAAPFLPDLPEIQPCYAPRGEGTTNGRVPAVLE